MKVQEFDQRVAYVRQRILDASAAIAEAEKEGALLEGAVLSSKSLGGGFDFLVRLKRISSALRTAHAVFGDMFVDMESPDAEV